MDHLEPFEDADLDNPYAPPKAAYAPLEPMAEFGSIDFTASDILNWSWTIFKDKMGMCMALVWGAALLNFGIQFGAGLILGVVVTALKDQGIALGVQFMVQILGIVIQVWLQIGMNLGLLRLARRQPVAFDIVFSGGRYLVSVILAGILVGLIAFGSIVIPIALGAVIMWTQSDPSVGLIVGALAAIPCAIAVMYLFARYSQFYFLIIDRNVGLLESIPLSWKLTQKRAGTIILVYFLQTAVVLAGFLALCVGLIFAIPLATLLLAVNYLALIGKVKAHERIPDLPATAWEEEL